MTSARWRTSTSPAGNRPAAGDRWSGTAGAAAVPSGPVFQQPVCVLRTAAGPDQGAAAGGRRIRAAVQTGGRGRVPVATGPAGDAKIQLERNCLNVRSTSIGIEGKCKRGLFGTISLTLGNSTLPLGDGLVADRKLLHQLPLGQSLTFSFGGDESSDFELIHSLPPFFFTFSLTKKRPHFHPRRIEKPSTFRRGHFFCSVLRLARPLYSSNSPGNRWVKTLFRKPGAAR